jgi:hypothetical protein
VLESSAEERQLHARFERRLRRRFVRALFVRALVKYLPAAHPPEHPLGHARDDVRHVRDRGRRARVKDDSAVLASGKDPVERDDVQVHGASERPVEALHEGHRARLAAVDAAGLRLLLLPPGNLLHEKAVLRSQRGGALGVYAANFVRRRSRFADRVRRRSCGWRRKA